MSYPPPIEGETAERLYKQARFFYEQYERMKAVVYSALGENGEFPSLPQDWPKRPFYWRTWLRELAGLGLKP